MAEPRLSASAETFKKLYEDCQQLKFMTQVLENYAFQALLQRHEVENFQLLYLLELLSGLALKTRLLMNDLEKRLCGQVD